MLCLKKCIHEKAFLLKVHMNQEAEQVVCVWPDNQNDLRLIQAMYDSEIEANDNIKI